MRFLAYLWMISRARPPPAWRYHEAHHDHERMMDLFEARDVDGIIDLMALTPRPGRRGRRPLGSPLPPTRFPPRGSRSHPHLRPRPSAHPYRTRPAQQSHWPAHSQRHLRARD